MFQLGSQSQAPLIVEQHNFVLQECVPQLVCPVGGIERHGHAAVGSVLADAITKTPNDIVPEAQAEMMLKIQVKNVVVFT